MLFIIDTNKEFLAVKEANKSGIPIVAILDSNSNPEGIDYPIPGNDDAIRSIEFYCNAVAETIKNNKSINQENKLKIKFKMSFTPEDIKKLRNKTGAGMMDCKKALDETNDIEKALNG